MKSCKVRWADASVSTRKVDFPYYFSYGNGEADKILDCVIFLVQR